MTTVADMVKARKRLGISQKKLSRLLKKDATFICKIENKRRRFSPEVAERVKLVLSRLRKAAK